jgi:hypothetical protein
MRSMFPYLLAIPLTLRSFSGHLQAQGQKDRDRAEAEGRNCAYQGQGASFHLLGTDGSAAYPLGTDRFIADLDYKSTDNDYWYYTPSGTRDGLTDLWAFARKDDSCGMRWVWRQQGGRWYPYGPMRFWGEKPLSTRVVRTATTTVLATNPDAGNALIDLADQIPGIKADLKKSLKTIGQALGGTLPENR